MLIVSFVSTVLLRVLSKSGPASGSTISCSPRISLLAPGRNNTDTISDEDITSEVATGLGTEEAPRPGVKRPHASDSNSNIEPGMQ